MNSDQRTILALIATGRITPAQAERLLSALNESREMVWLVALCLAGACLAQFRLSELLPLVHFCNTQIPAMAQAVHLALSPITDLMPLTRIGGLL